MASNLDFSADINILPVVDRISQSDRLRDDLPRRRDQIRRKPHKKDSRDTSPEDILTSTSSMSSTSSTSDDDEMGKHQLDLMV